MEVFVKDNKKENKTTSNEKAPRKSKCAPLTSMDSVKWSLRGDSHLPHCYTERKGNKSIKVNEKLKCDLFIYNLAYSLEWKLTKTS